MANRREYESVETYLQHLRASLEGLPAGEREEAYRELAQHVESMIDQALSAGGDQKDAVHAALEKFGDPKEIGEALVSHRWAEVFGKMQAARRSRRRWPEWLLPQAAGLYGVASFQFERALHFTGLPEIVVAVLLGSVVGAATGWCWAQRRERSAYAMGEEKPARLEASRKGRRVPAVVLAGPIAAVLVISVQVALIGYFFAKGIVPELPAAHRRDIESLQLFAAIMVASNFVTGKLIEKALLARIRRAPSS